MRSSLGMYMDTLPLGAPGLADTWMITGTLTPLTPPGADVLASVRGFVDGARRTAGLCTGCFVLAQAGVLDYRRAMTHWAYAKKLRELHPKIEVEEDRIFIVDGQIWTSAGMTAALDMALGMVEKDLGAEMARSVARKLVMHQRRSGGQSQHSELLKKLVLGIAGICARYSSADSAYRHKRCEGMHGGWYLLKKRC